MKKENRIYLGLLAGAIALLLIFTYISAQVYRRSLPVVETADIASGTVKRTYTMPGAFQYQSAQQIILPVPVKIEEIYVSAGEAVAEGMKILKIDTEYLRIEMLKLELQLEAAREQKEREEDERQRQILAYQIQEQEDAFVYLQEILEGDGIFCAACRGEIRGVYTEKDSDEPADKLLVSICDKDKGAEITWSMKEEGIFFERFYVDLRLTNGHTTETRTVILENVRKSYDAKTNMIYYTASVPETDNMLSMHDAESLTVTAYYVSDVYVSLVPVSAVNYEADGTASVYELRTREKSFGTEYYVRKQTITVLDKDSNYAATGTSFKDSRIIVNSSETLYDRAIVWVEE